MWWTILIILAVIILAVTIIKTRGNGVSEKIAKCIGENSVIYTQLGCHACRIQEEMFGENYKHLKVIDCFYEKDKCEEISLTPTWMVKGQKYTGVQSIEKLKELTGC